MSSDLLTAASLLLAAIAMVFSVWYPELSKTSSGDVNLTEANEVLHVRAYPLVIAAAIAIAVLAPPFVDVVREAFDALKNGGYDYDATKAIFAVVWMILLGFAIILTRLVWQVRRTTRALREKHDAILATQAEINGM